MPEPGFDRTWLERVKSGEDEASRELIREHYGLVLKIVRGHLPRRMDEEDLAQMIFVKVFQKIEQYNGSAPLSHWISRIAVNTCLNELRSEKVRPELRWADLHEDEASALDRVLEQKEEASADEQSATRELAAKLLQTLSPLDRAILTMIDLEGRTIAEAAEATGSNAGVVKIRAFRARRKLRKELERLERTK
ncbi:MAG: RNA polymerase subunit sigma-24 [Verrucomicrobia bacterium SCN 57-15]|nr:MAG: RNA polymerase subunit sigma-24 [Verrucomicrobia bacterium SCN 57-15]